MESPDSKEVSVLIRNTNLVTIRSIIKVSITLGQTDKTKPESGTMDTAAELQEIIDNEIKMKG